MTKRYGDTAVVDDLSLEIAPGRCHGLLGPNGAGKTTTLRLALGLIEADAGEIRLLGHRMPHEAAAARARVGVVPQTDSLDPDFTVRENLLTYGRYFGLGHRDAESRIPALLEFAGLTGKSEAKVPTLSGGMKRRLTLARALVNDPELVVLDEPTTGLDPQARHLVWQGLRRLIHQGKTLLLTTHFMDEAERLCDRISIIDHGRIIAEGSPRELITRHIEPHVVEVYGAGLANWEDGTGKSFDGPPQERLGPLGGRAAPPAWASDLAFLCRRCEHAGETLFCYTDDPKAVIDALDRRMDLRYLHRPANLEDVFLKLTGRDLRD